MKNILAITTIPKGKLTGSNTVNDLWTPPPRKSSQTKNPPILNSSHLKNPPILISSHNPSSEGVGAFVKGYNLK